MQLGTGQVFLVQAEVCPDVLVGQLGCAEDLLFLVLFHAKRVQSLALDHHLLLQAVVFDAPELHLEVGLLTLFIVEEAKLVDQASLLVGQIVEADGLAELSL